MNAIGYTDYAYNVKLGINPSGAYAGMSLSSISKSSLTVLFCDNSGAQLGGSVNYTTGCGSGATCSEALATFKTPTTQGALIHLDGQNYAFVDGHVKWYNAASKTQSAKVYNYATTDTNIAASAGSPTFNLDPTS